MASATSTSLLTAEEYMALPDEFDGPTELVKGVLVTIPPPWPRHGEICSRVAYLIGRYLEDHPIGRVLTNDSSMITERNPDSVRGPDVSYYSFDRVPKGPLPRVLLPVPPSLCSKSVRRATAGVSCTRKLLNTFMSACKPFVF